MPDFHTRLKEVMDRRGIKASQLSERMGRSPSAISNLIIKRSDPKISTVAEMCSILDCSIDYLTGTGDTAIAYIGHDEDYISEKAVELIGETLRAIQSKATNTKRQPTIDEVTNWWWSEGGRLKSMGQLSDFFDIYHEPPSDNNLITSHQMGRTSAAAETFGIKTTAELNSQLSSLKDPLARSLAESQRKTLETRQPRLTMEEIEIPVTNGSVMVSYRRLYLPMEVDTKRRYVLNFSQRLSPKPLRS